MQHLETDTGPSDPYWGKKEKNVSTPVPLMTKTMLSHNFGILASVENPVSCAQADGNDNMSSTPSGYKPRLDLGPDSHRPVLEIPIE